MEQRPTLNAEGRRTFSHQDREGREDGKGRIARLVAQLGEEVELAAIRREKAQKLRDAASGRARAVSAGLGRGAPAIALARRSFDEGG
jgi:hypothetical protein